jgi:tight adherence protein B
MLIPALSFLVVAAFIVGLHWAVVLRLEEGDQSALLKRLKPESVLQKNLGLVRAPELMSSIGPLNRILQRYSASIAPLKQTLDDSGLPVSLSVFILLSVCIVLCAGLVIGFYGGPVWLAAMGGVVSTGIPVWAVKMARARRVLKFEEQFPETVELIGRALRAGHAFATGVQMVADEMPAPTGPEFRMLYDRQNFGAALPDALRAFAERVPTLDARFFVTAVLTQREAGGNLSEVLDRLAAVMRERFRIKREVRVRSAHGRITATALAGMPPVLAALMFINDPAQVRLMISDPLGVRMLIVGGVLEILGLLVIRKLVNIEY